MTAVPPTGPGVGGAIDAVRNVQGWMTDDQARRLWAAAARVPAGGRMVEIGSFHGRSAIVLGLAAPRSAELVAIDPHMGSDRGPNEYERDDRLGDDDHDAFHANLAGANLGERVRHVRRTSGDALVEVDGELDLLYVDGAHRYAYARDDIERWGARVRPGGTLLVHDSFNAIGVMLAQMQLLVGSSEFRYVGRSGSLAEWQRRPLRGRLRARNAVEQLLELPYFARNMLMKVLITARLRPIARLLGEHRHWPY